MWSLLKAGIFERVLVANEFFDDNRNQWLNELFQSENERAYDHILLRIIERSTSSSNCLNGSREAIHIDNSFGLSTGLRHGMSPCASNWYRRGILFLETVRGLTEEFRPKVIISSFDDTFFWSVTKNRYWFLQKFWQFSISSDGKTI